MTESGPHGFLSKFAIPRRAALIFAIWFLSALPALAQDSTPGSGVKSRDTICAREAPWNRNNKFDHRADDIKKASDWAPPAPYSKHPAGKITGIWSFELKGIAPGGDVATAGRLAFYPDTGDETCEGICPYVTASANAKWLAGGVRWGHKNYGMRTPEEPEDIPPSYIDLSEDGVLTIKQPQYYPFPKITARFDPGTPDSFTGTWSLSGSGKEKTGKVVFTRFEPKITKVKYISTVNDAVAPKEIGCVALNYDEQTWGPGNDMRGNRPGFDIDVFSDDFSRMAAGIYRLWIDPKTKLEIDGSGPGLLFAHDSSGKVINKVIGLRIHINIWPGSEWGPKTLYIDGTPITFDYYVKPVYKFSLNPTKFQLVEGHFPETPRAGRPVHLGLRLVNLPDYSAKNTILNVRLVDAKSFEPARNVKVADKACASNGDGDLRCTFGKTRFAGVDETEIIVPMPDNGLRWFADWTTDGIPNESKRSGLISADPSPLILYAFSLSDQTGTFRAQTKDFLYPYPNGGVVSQKREVILFGRNLPTDSMDEAPHIESMDPAISYFPRTGEVYSDRYDAAWKDLSKRLSVPVETLKKKFEILLLEARISGKILPGEKSLKLNGELANWDLRFGGLSANVEFVRENDPYEDNEDDEDDDVLSSAYVPERIYVRVKTSSALPVDSLPMTLYLRQTVRDPGMVAAGAKPAVRGKIKFTAKRTSQGYYYSPPIRLIDKGNRRLSPPSEISDIPVNIFVNGGGTDQLAAEINHSFAVKSFAMPILPAGAALTVSRSPARHRSARDPNQESDYLFKSALSEAANCYDNISVDDWDKLSESESQRYYNIVALTFDDQHIRTTTVTFGHHAAMLLMRKMFIEQLNEQLISDNQILQSELSLKGFLNAMRLELDNDRLPINRVKVTAPDGSQVEFGSSALSENIDELSRRFHSSPEEMAKWRLTATAEALTRIDSAASEAAEAARTVDTCDVRGLLNLTGTGFKTIAQALKPRLMRLTEAEDSSGLTRLFWEPDDVARAWVDDIADTAKRFHAQEQAAEQDDTLLVVAFGLVSMPVMIYGSTSVALSLIATDLSMLGADAVSAWNKSYNSYAEIDFSRDAAVVIGFERNEEAIRKAYTWLDAYVRTLVDVGAGVVSIVGGGEKVAEGLLHSDGVVVRGRAAVEDLSQQGGRLRALSEAEQRDLQIYAMRAKARELAAGVEALDAIERQAVTAVDEDFRAMRTELIRQTDPSKPLGVGEKVALPFPFDLKEAQVRFIPTEVAAPSSSGGIPLPAWTLEEPVEMIRATDEASARIFRTGEFDTTKIFKGGAAQDDIGTDIFRGGRTEDEIGTEILRGGKTEDEIETTILKKGDAGQDDIGTDIIRGGESGAEGAPVEGPGGRPPPDNPGTTPGGEVPATHKTELTPDLALKLEFFDNLEQRVKQLKDEIFVLPSSMTKGDPVLLHIGDVRGAGTFKAAAEGVMVADLGAGTPFSKFDTLVKFSFGVDDAAERIGRGYLESIHSTHFVLPREVLNIEIPANAQGYLKYFRRVSVVEDLKAEAEALFKSGKITQAHRDALKGAIDDLNNSGIVLLDFKLNNFSFIERDGVIKVGFFDFGGFVRVKGADPALAREIQNLVSGPWANVRQALESHGIEWANNIAFRTDGRREVVRKLYHDAFENINQLGASSIDDFGFTPSAGELMDPKTTAMFAPGNR